MRDTAFELVDYMLFVDEAPMPSPVKGASAFTTEFPSKGPRDKKGRSLRDLDLTRRLLRYPCSYMIYNEAFDALPSAAKGLVYERMWGICQVRSKRGLLETLARGPPRHHRNPARHQDRPS